MFQYDDYQLAILQFGKCPICGHKSQRNDEFLNLTE